MGANITGLWWARVKQQADTAVQLSTSAQFVRAESSATLSPTGPVTVEAWIKPTSLTGSTPQTIVSKRGTTATNSGGYELSLNPSSGRITFTVYRANGTAATTLTSAQTVTANQWVHVAGCADAVNIAVFVGGVRTQVPLGALPQAGTTRLFIGKSTIGNPFVGKVDEVRISSVYRYTLSAFVAQTSFFNDASTLALWKFNDGSGTSAVDIAGNENVATLVGTPPWVAGVTTGS